MSQSRYLEYDGKRHKITAILPLTECKYCGRKSELNFWTPEYGLTCWNCYNKRRVSA